MRHDDVGTTRTAELKLVGDWKNEPAWLAFQARYDPHLRRCCERLGLRGEAADDVCQETWLEVAKRMRSFVYDPAGTFRGWLWKVCYHEAIDYLEQTKLERTFSLDPRHASHDGPLMEEAPVTAAGSSADQEDLALAGLFAEAERIQAAVQKRVEPHTWEAFWLVGVALWSVEETARYLNMQHASVYKAKARVAQKLRDEARFSTRLETETA